MFKNYRNKCQKDIQNIYLEYINYIKLIHKLCS